MVLVGAVRDYLNRVLNDIAGMKVLILDAQTVRAHHSLGFGFFWFFNFFNFFGWCLGFGSDRIGVWTLGNLSFYDVEFVSQFYDPPQCCRMMGSVAECWSR